MSLDDWLAALDERHLSDLTQAEVTRALRALSSCYVERREKLARGGALDGAGKRAAFALFYGPQHFFITREIVRALRPLQAPSDEIAEPGPQANLPPYSRVVDLGCGTGTAGAAAATETDAAVVGFDVNPWAVAEANWSYRTLGVQGHATVANIARVKVTATPGTLVLAAYVVNELSEQTRGPLLRQLQDAHARGASLLVVEPIGRRVNRWWDEWAGAFIDMGGRQNDWRFRTTLPPRQRALARAAGLDVQELTARSLFVGSNQIPRGSSLSREV